MKKGQRVIRKPELFSTIGLSDATIWRLEKAGKFPKRISLGGNSVGWFDNEVDEWLAKKASDRMGTESAVIRPCHRALQSDTDAVADR